MSSYLISKYKGKYMIKCEYDVETNQFPRNLKGTFEDIDCYIDCYNNIHIYHYGYRILEAYIPSLIRGHNIIKAIKTNLGDDIIFCIQETDSEVLFRFNSEHMEDLEKYLKPKTSGASISPFSSNNLPKNKEYKIPDNKLESYKRIVAKVSKELILNITHTTNRFLKSLVTKKNTWDNIKADMALKGLKGKEYIHSIGKWEEYIKYLEKELCS